MPVPPPVMTAILPAKSLIALPPLFLDGIVDEPVPGRQRKGRPWPLRSHVLAAVDMQLGTGNVARLLRAQIIDRLGDFLGKAEAAERQAFDELVGPRRQDRGVDLAGRDGVDANAERSEVRRHL